MLATSEIKSKATISISAQADSALESGYNVDYSNSSDITCKIPVLIPENKASQASTTILLKNTNIQTLV